MSTLNVIASVTAGAVLWVACASFVFRYHSTTTAASERSNRTGSLVFRVITVVLGPVTIAVVIWGLVVYGCYWAFAWAFGLTPERIKRFKA